ncbi:isocitrate lyase/PEP mutase family protein [Halapricum salinum]|uniref:Carboxyvinyl-carboxyphosphonate phosphorylmutase n=1 Tax=Halapricum salinum TaxID=1457250 RepID=A0A4D6HAT5_9EURY|nr:isocitrate lyase/PEP mutase family protein [Halapricum salinum]QCC50152.1 carboxyvinyl-carboxyphosphonate phosphorylmutase [Halapricum salinum]
MADEPATELRRLLDQPEITVFPGAYDTMSAKLAEQAGFETVFTSGFSIAATQLGLPDLGLMTASENVDRIRRITESISIPLVADMDTGYGNALNVRRTIGECIDAGVAGAILEDQQWPKRCGHMDEKRVVPTDEHVRRIRAAADVREERDSDFLLIGRTDAREPHGLDEAIERGRAYERAGADVVFVEAPQSREELERIATAFDAPTFANMIEGGKTPVLSADELDDLGFDIVVYPLTALFAMTRAVREAYEALATHGTTDAVETVTFAQFEDVLGTESYRERQREYAEE